MEESVTKTKDEALQDSLKAGDFYRAKQDYEEEQKLLAAMRLKHSTQRISLKLPRDLTEVQEYAKLSKKPVKRKSVLATLGSKISEKKALVLESPAIVAYNAGEEKGALAAAAEESSVVSGGSDLNGVLPSPAGVLMAQREKAAAPSASMPRGIASSAPSPSSTPVPEVEGAVASGSFGNVDSFATGFSYAREGDASQLATAGMRSGDAAIQSEDLDAILNTPSSRLRKTKAAGEKRDKQTADPFGDVASDSESYDELGGDVDAFAGQAITRTNSLAFKKEQLQGQLSEKPAEEFRAANEILNEELAEHDVD